MEHFTPWRDMPGLLLFGSKRIVGELNIVRIRPSRVRTYLCSATGTAPDGECR
jgi:hypothetical protein